MMVSALHMQMHMQGFRTHQGPLEATVKSSASFDPGFEFKSDGTNRPSMEPDREEQRQTASHELLTSFRAYARAVVRCVCQLSDYCHTRTLGPSASCD